MRMFDVFSIDRKVIGLDRTVKSPLEQRNDTPLSLMEASKLGSELNKEGHVVELRQRDDDD